MPSADAEWAEAVARFTARAAQHRVNDAPDDADTYFFWQTLVGAWPLEPARALQVMEKSMSEAKRRTSWSRPDEAYEAGVKSFVEAVLGDADLRGEIAAFVARIEPAARVNALARTLIKLTAPGIPEFTANAWL